MKAVLLIDGGHLRASAKKAGIKYNNSFIERFAHMCFDEDEYLLRIFYYDAPQYRGGAKKPISGDYQQFNGADNWLKQLASLERFAVRRGTIGFRGWKPKKIPIASEPLTDDDFAPVFEQKGVDMRIGLDIAEFSQAKSADRIILVSGDTDMLPAMKMARRAGLEIVSVQLQDPALSLPMDLKAHSDIVRPVPWPKQVSFRLADRRL